MAKRGKPDAVYWQAIAKAEHEVVQWALEAAEGNLVAAGTLLGIHWTYLRKRMIRLGIPLPERKEKSA